MERLLYHLNPVTWADWLIGRVMSVLAEVGAVSSFGFRIARKSITPPFYLGEGLRGFALLTQRCAPPVVMVLFTLGAVMSLQAGSIIKLVSAEPLLGGVMALFTFRELGPVIGSVLVAAQGGTSTATELGAMRIKEEFDAMELMAIDPERMGVAPRFIAFLLAAPILCILGNTAGIVGGFLVTMAITDISSGTFLESIFSYVTLLDVWNGIFKSMIFGFSVASISCYYGFFVRGGPVEVGQAANKSVVYSLIVVLGLNYLVSTALFGAAGGLQKF